MLPHDPFSRLVILSLRMPPTWSRSCFLSGDGMPRCGPPPRQLTASSSLLLWARSLLTAALHSYEFELNSHCHRWCPVRASTTQLRVGSSDADGARSLAGVHLRAYGSAHARMSVQADDMVGACLLRGGVTCPDGTRSIDTGAPPPLRRVIRPALDYAIAEVCAHVVWLPACSTVASAFGSPFPWHGFELRVRPMPRAAARRPAQPPLRCRGPLF